LSGPSEFFERAYAPLLTAIPDLERRDWIVLAGPTEQGGNWVGCGGHYVGRFPAPWLDIPSTGQFVHMRFHEFYRFVDNKVVEIQAIWDVPEVMIQANAWPMSPSLGRELMVPGPL
jgi:predicted ester cyclase